MIVAYARTLGVVIEPEYFTTPHPDVVNLQYMAVQGYQPFDDKLDAIMGVLQQVIQVQATAMAQSTVHIYTSEPKNELSEKLSESVSDKAIPLIGKIGKVQKEYNQETVERVKKYSHLKPAQIVELTGLSKTTVYDILHQLKGKLQ